MRLPYDIHLQSKQCVSLMLSTTKKDASALCFNSYKKMRLPYTFKS